MSISEITNYNLSYEFLLKAVAEFKNYIAGVASNDMFIYTSDAALNQMLEKNPPISDKAEDDFLNHVIQFAFYKPEFISRVVAHCCERSRSWRRRS